MASEQHDTVFDHDLEDDDDESSQSQDDDDDLENDDAIIEENDDVLPDEEDEEDLNPISCSPAIAVPVAVPSASAVTIAVPNGVSDAPSLSLESTPDTKRQRVESTTTTTLVIHQQQQEEKKPQPQQMDESRRLFQRLWTDEDEIELLQGFLDYTTQRGSNHHDTALFYDQIKSKLQLDFNKNQLVEKLRRLKKKYRNVLSKISSGKDFSFKSPHDQATFEISRKIWSSTGKICVEDANLDDDDANPSPNPNFNDADVKIEDHNKSTPRSRKRSRSRSSTAAAAAPAAAAASGGLKFEDKRLPNDTDVSNNINNVNNISNSNVNVSHLIEETVKSCLSPLFKELLSNALASGPCGARGIGGLAMNAMPLSFGVGEMMVDEKWRKQQVLELEVYSKRLELVQDQIRAQLEELRSMGG
ncbi:transcription regulator, putative [Ricinus communis]|uniref:Transcription regulator, putative n=1 Tax=Ricinus communis TaxID=3988 RepID=B9RET1_RICCO|nr:transcription regulator, putative [Ricinus communis]|eukprot:XP_002512250.1 probable transcription factor At5g28040 [Ricinus communis]